MQDLNTVAEFGYPSRCCLTSAGSPSSSFALLLVLLHAAPAAALGHHLLLHHVDDLVGDSQVLDGASPDVALRHPPELVSILHGNSKHSRASLEIPIQFWV